MILYAHKRYGNKVRELAAVCLSQQWTETSSVWFDDVGISAFHSCIVVDLWQFLSEWRLLLSECVLLPCSRTRNCTALCTNLSYNRSSLYRLRTDNTESTSHMIARQRVHLRDDCCLATSYNIRALGHIFHCCTFRRVYRTVA
jgi:hypothetical protein